MRAAPCSEPREAASGAAGAVRAGARPRCAPPPQRRSARKGDEQKVFTVTIFLAPDKVLTNPNESFAASRAHSDSAAPRRLKRGTQRSKWCADLQQNAEITDIIACQSRMQLPRAFFPGAQEDGNSLQFAVMLAQAIHFSAIHAGSGGSLAVPVIRTNPSAKV